MKKIKRALTIAVSLSGLALACYFSSKIWLEGHKGDETSATAQAVEPGPQGFKFTHKKSEPLSVESFPNPEANATSVIPELARIARFSKPIVKVNGAIITAAELEEEVGRLVVSPSIHGGMDAAKKDQLRKTAMEELIVRELAYQRAKAIGLRPDKKEVAAAIRKIRQRYKTKKGFEQALKAEEITESEFEERIERQLLLQKILQVEIEDKAKVREDDVRAYYENNKAKFVIPESLHLRSIVIKIERGKEEEAKKRIDDVYEQLKAGGDFYDLAYRFSEDDYKVFGGDYGSVHRGQLVPELEEIAFAATVNEITAPTKTKYGWHIIKVEDKKPDHQLEYAEVKEKIEKNLYEKRRAQRRSEFIKDLKAVAEIEYLNG